MEKFKDTLIHQDGRYHVKWPWRQDFTELPNNRQLALGRLKSCHKGLKGNFELMEEYNTVILKQLQDGVLEKVPQSASSEMKYFIAHHPLIIPHKVTTKLRIVYDVSSKPHYLPLDGMVNIPIYLVWGAGYSSTQLNFICRSHNIQQWIYETRPYKAENVK